MSNENEFKFIEDVNLNNEVYKVYGLEKIGNPAILNPDTLIPCKPLNPIKILERVAICDSKVRKLPDVVVPGQTFECISLEEDQAKFILNS